ncbi:MAG: Nif3-like dinuclear metal center hexameric protein [Muribaculaceae bacterium]|nr:Nif3-like dinuclear metal center hexameric protein [Muribaculaceae bacterium]MDE6331607.1 Nif3-like dinuclear metal center hexameric protein [Muribaculaceae bacterium]
MLNGHIIEAIEALAHPSYQESWDNTGIQVGSRRAECSGVLLCVDVTPAIVEEARERGCSLIISHHPLIFKGLKRLSGNTPVEEAVMAAIRYGITVYSCHTALDSARGGVSYTMAEMLGAEVRHVLSPLADRLICLSVTTDDKGEDSVRMAMIELGADEQLTRQESCMASAYSLESSSDNFVDIEEQKAVKLTATLPADCIGKIATRLGELTCRIFGYRVIPLRQSDPSLGLGAYAVFEPAISISELISRIKTTFGSPVVRSTRIDDPERPIRRLGICGGSGGEFIGAALRSGAEAYLSSDIRYHDFVDWQNEILLLDIGHFESESCTKQIFYNAITEKFPNFAVYKSELESNPIKYQ